MAVSTTTKKTVTAKKSTIAKKPAVSTKEKKPADVTKPTIKKTEQPKPVSSKIVTFDDFWTKMGSRAVSDGHGVRGIINLTLKHAGNNVSFQEFVRHNPYSDQTVEQYSKLAFEFKSPATA